MKIDQLSFPAEIRRLEVGSIEDNGDNTLCVTAAHCHVGTPEMTVLGTVAPIVWDEGSDFWRFTWHRCVSVLILNESYALSDPPRPRWNAFCSARTTSRSSPSAARRRGRTTPILDV